MNPLAAAKAIYALIQNPAHAGWTQSPFETEISAILATNRITTRPHLDLVELELIKLINNAAAAAPGATGACWYNGPSGLQCQPGLTQPVCETAPFFGRWFPNTGCMEPAGRALHAAGINVVPPPGATTGS